MAGKLVAVHIPKLGPGTHEDGRGLRLVVGANGKKRQWVLRYQINKKRRDMGLGPFPEVTLARAREKALEARRLLKDHKRDPLEAQKSDRQQTFREVAEALIEAKKAGWKNAKHAAQWTATLEAYAYPKLGALSVREIQTEQVLVVLRPIWTTKPETASRVRQRIEAVLDAAKAEGQRTGDNPARWRGHLAVLLSHPADVRAVEHHAALPWQELPTFMKALAARQGVAARALAFAILTAARSGEVRNMRWSEIDRDRALWTVPPERMKARKEHAVPLSAAALALIGEPGKPDQLVFPSEMKRGAALSDVTLGAVLKRMGRADLTVHGFRSTFRDWAGETTAHPREVMEAALAHRLKDKAEAAYARGDLLTKRRLLMEDWAKFTVSPPAVVLTMPRTGTAS